MPRDFDETAVLVTGGTGYIGRHLVEALLDQNARVRVLVRANSQIPSAWAGTVELCCGDLEFPESLGAACRGIDTLFHAAAYAHTEVDVSSHEAERHWRVNALGTRRLAEVAAEAGVKRFLFLSSVKAMGEGEKRCVDEEWSAPPRSPYGKAKRAAEQWVVEIGQRHFMHVVNLRLAMVYGAGAKGNLGRMIEGIRRGWFPPLPEVGNQRSMVHVCDVIQAALRAATHPLANQKTYLVTDGRFYSSREIYELICVGLGMPVRAWAVPVCLLRSVARIGDITSRLRRRHSGFNSETLDKLLGWACYRSDRIQRELGYRPSRNLVDSLAEILREGPHVGEFGS
jgi:UDP-glucose 4-epimerase